MKCLIDISKKPFKITFLIHARDNKGNRARAQRVTDKRFHDYLELAEILVVKSENSKQQKLVMGSFVSMGRAFL
ncbi:hypothetical protein N836_21340 [Leptolyngbya sp. Heron Island J]|nr:hypothetical protein N836_21340 [Leptolyngbya sp. Heron Island J]